MSRLRPRRVQVLPLLGLTTIWVLLWGNLSVANVLGGLLLGALVLWAFPLPALGTGLSPQPLPLARLVLRFLRDLVVASVEVSWYALRPQGPPRSSMVVVPLTARGPVVQTVVTEMTSLVPGSIVVELDPTAPSMTLHALGAEDEAAVEQVRSDVQALEQRVLRALGTDDRGRTPTDADDEEVTT